MTLWGRCMSALRDSEDSCLLARTVFILLSKVAGRHEYNSPEAISKLLLRLKVRNERCDELFESKTDTWGVHRPSWKVTNKNMDIVYPKLQHTERVKISLCTKWLASFPSKTSLKIDCSSLSSLFLVSYFWRKA